MLQKLDEAAKQKDNIQAEFSIEREELNQLVKKAEDEGHQVRDVYENMVAEMKNELGKLENYTFYVVMYFFMIIKIPTIICFRKRNQEI